MQNFDDEDRKWIIVTLSSDRPKTSHHEVTSWSQPPAQRRTMPTAYPNTVDFSNIDAGHAFAALPAHILITHILSSRNLPDPSDLARLRAVSREMRDAVVATGRRVYELNAENAIHFGELSGMRLLHQRGDLDQRVDLDDGDEDYNDPNDDTFSLCTFAAKLGQLEVLKWLRENDSPWSERTSDEAACNGHLEVLQWARENGCPWDADTCELSASENGHKKLQAWILKCAPDKGKKAEHNGVVSAAHGSPLHIAAAKGHEAAVQAQIESGADVNKVVVNGVTPLFIAAGAGHVEAVRVLIEAGADINKVADDGATPLYMAVQFGHEVVLRALIEADADINKATNDGSTPLIKAAEKGHKAVVRALIEADVDVNKAKDDGGTALGIAA